SRRGPCFAQEANPGLIVAAPRLKKFDCDALIERFVARGHDDAHAARSDYALDAIFARDDVACRNGGSGARLDVGHWSDSNRISERRPGGNVRSIQHDVRGNRTATSLEKACSEGLIADRSHWRDDEAGGRGARG